MASILLVICILLVVCYALCKVSSVCQFMIKFFMFGVWNNVLGLLVVIASLLSLKPRDSANYWWWNFFSFCMNSNWLFGFNIKIIRGLDRLDAEEPYIIVSNHQTSMDQFVFLTAWAPGRFTVLAKNSLKYMLFYGLAMMACGAIFVDRSNPQKAKESSDRCVNYVKKQKGKLWVYPEGTRSNVADIDMLPFKKGAFHMAVQAQVPIVPLVVSSYRQMYNESKYIFDKVDIVMDALPDVPTDGLTVDDVPELTERVRTMMLERFYEISKLTNNN